MPYAFYYDTLGNEQMYGKVKAEIGEDSPQGLVVHLVVKHEDGLRHTMVWESQADWQRFSEERVRPAVNRVLAGAGVTSPPPPVEQELELVDLATPA